MAKSYAVSSCRRCVKLERERNEAEMKEGSVVGVVEEGNRNRGRRIALFR